MEIDNDFIPPPPPEIIDEPKEKASMSEVGTLVNIFFEPGRTFEDLRKKPRFILGALIIAILAMTVGFALQAKIGDEGLRSSISQQIEKSPQASAMSDEQKGAAIDMQIKIAGVVRYLVPVFVLVFLAIGGLCYWLGSKLFGGTGGFFHGLSVWVYSLLPPTLISTLGNLIVLAFKPVEQIDVLTAGKKGVLQANPGFLFGPDSNAVLVTLITTLDLFSIWGWILAAIGLRITNKMSSSSAWTVVLIFAAIGVLFRLLGALFSGVPG